jgi:hypothetical protein
MGILTALSAFRGSEAYVRNKFNDAIHTEEWKNGNPTSIMLRTKLAKEYIANHPSDFDYADSAYVEEYDCYDEVICFRMYRGVFAYDCSLHTAKYMSKGFSTLLITND